jgi:ABC-type nitrate/sulfonate/bicarbonate transport system substrate-binding protein
MKRAGADFSKVKIEQADFSALLGLLLQDRVDGILSFTTTGAVLAVAAAKAGHELEFYHYGKDIGTYGSVFFGAERFFQEKPDTARSVVKALECSYRAANEDVEAAATAFVARFPEKDREDVIVGAKAMSQIVFDTETFTANGFTWDEERLKNTLKLALEAQGIDGEVKEVDNYLYRPKDLRE